MSTRLFLSLLVVSACSSNVGVTRVEASIGFGLWGSTDTLDVTPQIVCEDDGTHAFPYHDSGVGGMGTMQQSSCTLSGIAIHRTLDLQAVADGIVAQSADYNVNILTGGIAGNSLLKQTARFFDGYAFSYGVSHAAPPLGDQAYAYVARDASKWMGQLANSIPDLQVADLVLPASHDAGMYTLNVTDTDKAVKALCMAYLDVKTVCDKAGPWGKQGIINFALTQKETVGDQLRLGTRMFDFRPAKPVAGGTAYHIHMIIAGVQFDTFLKGISTFLSSAPDEVVFIQITSAGIETSQFTPLTKSEVKTYLDQNIATGVGYDLVDDIKSYNNQFLSQVVAGGKRVIVVMGKTDVNDGYTDAAYGASITNPATVIKALKGTLGKCNSATYQYNVLQLQDTGSLWLKNNYSKLPKSKALAWINDLGLSGTGSILQATKSTFDHGTYAWLLETATLAGLAKCRAPVVLLNDFVDPVLTSRAIGLTHYRNKH